MTGVPVLETHAVRAPLGLRLLGAGDDRAVRGLRVTARPVDPPRHVTVAVESPSGAYGFHEISGIPQLRDGADAPTRQIAVHVEDPAGRHVPATYVVDAPARRPPAIPADGGGLYVFPSVNHPGQPGAVVVRAWLVHAATGKPAAHAILEVEAAGQQAFGVADAGGAVAAVLPLPEVDAGAVTGRPRAQWSATVRVRWQPSSQTRVAGLDTPTVASLLAQNLATIDRLPSDVVITESTARTIASDLPEGDPNRGRLLLQPA